MFPESFGMPLWEESTWAAGGFFNFFQLYIFTLTPSLPLLLEVSKKFVGKENELLIRKWSWVHGFWKLSECNQVQQASKEYSSSPLSMVSLSLVLVTCGQLQPGSRSSFWHMARRSIVAQCLPHSPHFTSSQRHLTLSQEEEWKVQYLGGKGRGERETIFI